MAGSTPEILSKARKCKGLFSKISAGKITVGGLLWALVRINSQIGNLFLQEPY